MGRQASLRKRHTAGNVNAVVSEAAPIGSFVAKLTPADFNGGNIVAFAIISGNRNNSFRIDNSAGEIYVRSALNFEQVSAYYLTVSARDNTGVEMQVIVFCLGRG
ncbi:MAG: cadherin repeat domain-containing protein [Bacteroidia bacterium]|nr:cadherin repeat domain-containing protein [Bacteroidia bacterium]